ncbi:carboxypeptidase-like regulatory domain-containing protein [Lacinutrix sp. WUR7]|uniref:carboxypeptidase-like regulatory domain-containing protein n=1 Tax=Lacinutrix sp. WUR7 TaxID=2653681 RepID=UPI00193EA478|nr:carboxypeptidase-like regulatory domain-containing protein [Lacinutrix sp. WUR7]QRM90443.1 carboxypeptidase-like regulatory domain-containing protein [Lacinutrix sp. WUR7]
MKFKNILFFLLLSIFSFFKIEAQTISGKVISSSNEEIPFATIQIGNDYGVISNEEGNFSIETKGFIATDSVTISCLGFEKNAFILEDFTSKEYVLNEKLNELSEVFLNHTALSADSIMFYVNANLKTNYKLDLNDFKVFSRKTDYIVGDLADFKIKKSTGFKRKQLKAFNDDFDKLETSLVNNKSKQYTDFVGSLKVLDKDNAKLEVEKAISLRDEKNNQSMESLAERGQDIVMKHLDKDKMYTVKSGFFKVTDSATVNKEEIKKRQDTVNTLRYAKNETFNMIKNSSFSNPDAKLDFVTNTRKYKYSLKDVTFLDSEMVYIIAFKPKRSSALYTGSLYVSNDTFAVIRADYDFYENRIGDKLNLRLLLGIKYIEKNKKGIVVYKKWDDNFYYPSYINTQIDRYFYVNRPIKFIENDNSRNKVAFNFKIEGTFKGKSELLIISRSDLQTTDFTNYTEKTRIDYENPKAYDATIWSDYNVLEPLNDMKNFKIESEEEN